MNQLKTINISDSSSTLFWLGKECAQGNGCMGPICVDYYTIWFSKYLTSWNIRVNITFSSDGLYTDSVFRHQAGIPGLLFHYVELCNRG